MLWQNRVVWLSLLSLWAIGCAEKKENESKSASMKEKIYIEGETPYEEDFDTEDATQGKVVTAKEAYLTTLYPKLVAQCAECHESTKSPFFASKDHDKAFSEIFDTGKVNLLNPEKSKIVQKMFPINHNCWQGGCESNSQEVSDLIKEWADKVTDGTIEALQKESEKNKTNPLTFSDARTRKISELPEGTFIFQLNQSNQDSGVISGDFIETISDQAFDGRYLSSSSNTNVTYQADDNTAGRVTLNFDVGEAGTYRVWARVQNPTENDNTLLIRLNNGNYANWETGVNQEAEFSWVQANTGNSDNLLEYELTAGSHTLEIQQAEDGVGIDLVAVTNLAGFNGDRLVEQVHVLSYDLSHLLGGDIKFEIEVAELDEFSYKFKNPTLITPNKNVKIKNLKIFVNGVTSSANATYSLVNTIIQAPGGVSFSEGSMIVAVDKGTDADEFVFQFEEIQIQQTDSE